MSDSKAVWEEMAKEHREDAEKASKAGDSLKARIAYQLAEMCQDQADAS